MNTNMNEEKVKQAENDFNKDVLSEMSGFGYTISSGVPNNYDSDTALSGDSALKVYQEMIDNDSTVYSLMTTIQMLFRRIEWIVDLPEHIRGESKAEEQRYFIETCLFGDMDKTFNEVMSDVMLMIAYGYSLFEVVFKKRLLETSIFNDGYYGVEKLNYIPPKTRHRWDIDERGNIKAFEQQDINDGTIHVIPYSKLMHFKMQEAEGNPEGKSLLRGAYRSWYLLKRIQDYEAIGIERDLNGVPVVSVPNELLQQAAAKDATAMIAVENYKKIARDMKANSQAGIIIPSDPFKDDEGKLSTFRRVTVELLSNKGTKSIDTDKVISRYQNDIARSVIASFIMLGSSERGSFALAEVQQSLFLAAIEALTEVIAKEFNRKLIPTLIKINGMDMDYIPYIRPSELQPKTFDDLSSSIMKLAQAGMPLFPDDVLENFIREKGGLPVKDPNYNGQVASGYADKENQTNYQDKETTEETKEESNGEK